MGLLSKSPCCRGSKSSSGFSWPPSALVGAMMTHVTHVPRGINSPTARSHALNKYMHKGMRAHCKHATPKLATREEGRGHKIQRRLQPVPQRASLFCILSYEAKRSFLHFQGILLLQGQTLGWPRADQQAKVRSRLATAAALGKAVTGALCALLPCVLGSKEYWCLPTGRTASFLSSWPSLVVIEDQALCLLSGACCSAPCSAAHETLPAGVHALKPATCYALLMEAILHVHALGTHTCAGRRLDESA